jgi:CHAT domain-containing protein
LKSDRPLVFLNACRVGSGGLSITGLGGWANVLVGSCGVGAVIAPLWSVNDALAREFARVFYDQLRSQPGCTVGQAVRQARRHVRDAAPHDPTWLAYTLYAHPNARIRLSSV